MSVTFPSLLITFFKLPLSSYSYSLPVFIGVTNKFSTSTSLEPISKIQELTLNDQDFYFHLL